MKTRHILQGVFRSYFFTITGIVFLTVFLPMSSYSQWQHTTSLGTSWADEFISTLKSSGSNIFTANINDDVFYSSDNGNTWNNITIYPKSEVSDFAFIGSIVFTSTRGYGVFRSMNNGSSWSAVNTGLPELDIVSLCAVGTRIFAGTYSSGVFISTNNGGSWTPVNNGLPASEKIQSIVSNGMSIIAVTGGDHLFYSGNNGVTWSAISNGLPSMNNIAVAFQGSTIFVGYALGVYYSTNNGSNWTPSQTNGSLFFNAGGCLYATPTVVIAGTSGWGLYYSTDGGMTFESAQGAGLPSQTFVGFLEFNGSFLFLAYKAESYGIWKNNPSTVLNDAELNGYNDIKLSPNPLISEAILSIDRNMHEADICVYNILGEPIIHHKFIGDKFIIKKGTMNSGLYFVVVTTKVGSYMEKLIVQ